MSTKGLLVMAYGTPKSPADIEPYYTHIRRGRPPTPELLEELTLRYEAIGGISPLAALTNAQLKALEDGLKEQSDEQWVVALGQKHADPFVEDGVVELANAGVTDIVGLVLAPHYSGFSVGEYQRRARETAEQHGIRLHEIHDWHMQPAYLDFLTNAVRDARSPMPERHTVLFTAHSLPERVLENDPYPDQLRQSAQVVAERLNIPSWSVAWQSAGRTPEPWRGPDILEELQRIADEGSADGVVVCAQGFTSDHLEVLYDLDIEANQIAQSLGLQFARTRSLNADASVMNALAGVVIDTAR